MIHEFTLVDWLDLLEGSAENAHRRGPVALSFAAGFQRSAVDQGVGQHLPRSSAVYDRPSRISAALRANLGKAADLFEECPLLTQGDIAAEIEYLARRQELGLPTERHLVERDSADGITDLAAWREKRGR